jgi:hypothetical protein
VALKAQGPHAEVLAGHLRLVVLTPEHGPDPEVLFRRSGAAEVVGRTSVPAGSPGLVVFDEMVLNARVEIELSHVSEKNVTRYPLLSRECSPPRGAR